MSTSGVYPSLRGKTVFITGGATGIGACLVDAFVTQKAHVAFVDRNEEAGQELAGSFGDATSIRPWFRSVDVTDVAELVSAVEDASADCGPVGALINNVGDDTRMKPEEITQEGWRQCMAVNLDAAFFATQAVAAQMRELGGGSVVNISSINALLGLPNMPGYVTAKAGLIGMTRALARDYGDANIRVNAILPGWVVTDRQLKDWLTPEAEAEWMKLVALKRRLTPADVANLALFLAADDSSMITGQTVTVDGGRT